MQKLQSQAKNGFLFNETALNLRLKGTQKAASTTSWKRRWLVINHHSTLFIKTWVILISSKVLICQRASMRKRPTKSSTPEKLLVRGQSWLPYQSKEDSALKSKSSTITVASSTRKLLRISRASMILLMLTDYSQTDSACQNSEQNLPCPRSTWKNRPLTAISIRIGATAICVSRLIRSQRHLVRRFQLWPPRNITRHSRLRSARSHSRLSQGNLARAKNRNTRLLTPRWSILRWL